MGGTEHPPAVPRTAADLTIGQAGVIASIEGHGSVVVRLLEMGLVPGTRVQLVKRAPMGDPLQLQLRGFHLSLRAVEAGRVQLREVAS